MNEAGRRQAVLASYLQTGFRISAVFISGCRRPLKSTPTASAELAPGVKSVGTRREESPDPV